MISVEVTLRQPITSTLVTVTLTVKSAVERVKGLLTGRMTKQEGEGMATEDPVNPAIDPSQIPAEPPAEPNPAPDTGEENGEDEGESEDEDADAESHKTEMQDMGGDAA